MKIVVENDLIHFEIIPLTFLKREVSSVFYTKNNKTLLQTFEHNKYLRHKILFSDKYSSYHDKKLGDFLKLIKEADDINYRSFLNKYGDSIFCEFKISNNLKDKGIYCFIVDNQIKYIGRCTDNLKKRINQGYGKIHPENCFIDGQATNCHINALINSAAEVSFGIYTMNDKTTDQIKDLEKLILKSATFEWNIQKS